LQDRDEGGDGEQDRVPDDTVECGAEGPKRGHVCGFVLARMNVLYRCQYLKTGGQAAASRLSPVATRLEATAEPDTAEHHWPVFKYRRRVPYGNEHTAQAKIASWHR
jgi:hypothetical protein